MREFILSLMPPTSDLYCQHQVSSEPVLPQSHRQVTLLLIGLRALNSSFASFLELLGSRPIAKTAQVLNRTGIQCSLRARHCFSHTRELIPLNPSQREMLRLPPLADEKAMSERMHVTYQGSYSQLTVEKQFNVRSIGLSFLNS